MPQGKYSSSEPSALESFCLDLRQHPTQNVLWLTDSLLEEGLAPQGDRGGGQLGTAIPHSFIQLLVEAISMKAFAGLGAAVLLLTLGTVASAFAQHEQEAVQPQQKQEQKHRQQQQQQAKQQNQQRDQQAQQQNQNRQPLAQLLGKYMVRN